jgi:hypothetical protein
MTARRVAIHAQLAGLASLDASVRLALRALHATYPDLARGLRDDHRIELTTACILAELAEDLLLALDDHRTYVLYNLAVLGDHDASQTAWPF